MFRRFTDYLILLAVFVAMIVAGSTTRSMSATVSVPRAGRVFSLLFASLFCARGDNSERADRAAGNVRGGGARGCPSRR